MIGARSRSGRRATVAPVVVILVVGAALAGFALGIVGLARPQPAQTSPLAHSTSQPPAPPKPHRTTLTRSAPVRLSIPTIGVNGGLQHLGVSADKKTVQLPASPMRAGWYDKGATPGEAGPTIIVGYIAGHGRLGVFRRLAALKVGQHITLRRADGKRVVYGVDQIASYPVHKFPSAKVYARTSRPTLRVITCGGALRPGPRVGNVVVFAHQLTVQA